MIARHKIATIYGLACALAASAQALAQSANPAAPLASLPLPTQPATSVAEITGTIQAAATVSANPGIPNGTAVYYTLSASVPDPSFSNSRSASGNATVSNGIISISANLPYDMLVSSSSDKIVFTLQLTATVLGTPALTFSTSFNSAFAPPANGTTTSLSFSGTI
ncbi:hypothetical protein [Methylocystis heyeri]|uniref:Uncharacterized protein n=1 Tax=Methylocystis heyeri TaxID=391905 RepID=A0A6B8KKJ7_9HYPH|nr:hypothetical protein [Methylocystis heyeri]QGM47455.1 hypothetical protein H2LOC_018150 [Methylocystis heyeri]